MEHVQKGGGWDNNRSSLEIVRSDSRVTRSSGMISKVVNEAIGCDKEVKPRKWNISGG
jgi:hypothetical protein